MNEKPPPTKKKPTPSEMPVHAIREGSVTASIWRRQSPSGYAYHDFSLTRTFESLSSKSSNSSRNFFARNRDDLAKAINAATQWIVEREAAEQSSLVA